MASCAHVPPPKFQDSDLRRPMAAWFPGAYDLRALSWAHVRVWGAAGRGWHTPVWLGIVRFARSSYANRALFGISTSAVSCGQLAGGACLACPIMRVWKAAGAGHCLSALARAPAECQWGASHRIGARAGLGWSQGNAPGPPSTEPRLRKHTKLGVDRTGLPDLGPRRRADLSLAAVPAGLPRRLGPSRLQSEPGSQRQAARCCKSQ